MHLLQQKRVPAAIVQRVKSADEYNNFMKLRVPPPTPIPSYEDARENHRRYEEKARKLLADNTSKAQEVLNARQKTIADDYNTNISASMTMTTRSEAEGAGSYRNSYELLNGTFSATDNNNNRETRFNNSDVMYHQFNQLRIQNKKVAKKGMRQLERTPIINPFTLGTAYHCAGFTVEGEFTVGPDSPDFYALLGTPNGTAAIFLLKDYAANLGIVDIKSVKFENRTLTIDFTSAREAANSRCVIL